MVENSGARVDGRDERLQDSVGKQRWGQLWAQRTFVEGGEEGKVSLSYLEQPEEGGSEICILRSSSLCCYI